MTRRMSCSMTVEAVEDRLKTATRRHTDTWRKVKVGDRLTLIEKGMGLPKGARQVVLAQVEVVSVRVELLHDIDEDECRREGFPHLTPDEFCVMWMRSHGYGAMVGRPEALKVTCRRIEWVYLDPPKELTDYPIAAWGEDGEHLLHFGHVSDEVMAWLVAAYMRHVGGFSDDEVEDHTRPPVTEVRRGYAMPSTSRRWDPDEPWLDWSPKVDETNGWPVTIWEYDS